MSRIEQENATVELVEIVEYGPEDVNKVATIYCESYTGKVAYELQDLNKMIQDIFEIGNINFLIGSGYCYEKLKTLGDLEKLIENNAQNNRENINTKNAVEALILYDFFSNSIYPHKQDIESNISYENSNKFILNLSGLLAKRNDKNLLKRVNVFTTNYDMFFELSLEKNKVYYNDGFAGRLSPVFSAKKLS